MSSSVSPTSSASASSSTSKELKGEDSENLNGNKHECEFQLSLIEKCKKVIDQCWEYEVQLYEQNFQHWCHPAEAVPSATAASSRSTPSRFHEAQRRIQINTKLFPYHQNCIYLLDMHFTIPTTSSSSTLTSNGHGYGCSYDDVIPNRHIMFGGALMFGNTNPRVRIDGHFPCTPYSILFTFMPYNRPSRDDSFNNSASDSDSDSDSDNGESDDEGEGQGEGFGDLLHGEEQVLEHFMAWEKVYENRRHEEIHECYSCTDSSSNSNSSFEIAQEERKQRRMEEKKRRKNNTTMIDNMHKGIRTKVLLKILKHSMSELQRDHFLARAVLLSMIEYKCFNNEDSGEGNKSGEEQGAGVQALRYFLLTFLSEYIYGCEGRCHQTYILNVNRIRGMMDDDFDDYDDEDDEDNDDNPRPTHFCRDWKNLVMTIQKLISDGIEFMTESHADLFVAFVTHLYDVSGWHEVEHMRALIGYDGDESINHCDKPFYFIKCIIIGLGVKSYEDRCRLKTLMRWKYHMTSSDNSNTSSSSSHPLLDEEIDAVSKSHLCSLNALVRIGKFSLLRLPADYITEHIGSYLVRYMVLSSIDLMPHSSCGRSDAVPVVGSSFIGDRFGGRNESMTNETRYKMEINSADMKNRRLEDVKRTFMDSCRTDDLENDAVFREIFLSPPSIELQNVVKGLFLSQLVDVEYSGVGYGDFFVWCRLPISIYDPMLYEHIVNYPSYSDEEDDSEEDEGVTSEDKKLYYYDDDGVKLTGERLKAKYDFSVLLLKQIWSEPWKPQNHSSFQSAFRQAVWTLVLCAHKYGMSADIAQTVSSFMSRDWWPDERARCWLYECEIDNASNLLFNHELKKCKKLIVCDGCKTAHACSQKHLKIIHHEGHGRMCKVPPIRYFNHEDATFCRIASSNNSSGNDEREICEEDSDDASCWESVDSGDVSESRTELIFRYFQERAAHRMEQPAFAAFYSE